MNLDRIDLPETNAYVGLLDGDAFSVYFIASYLKNAITQYTTLAEYRISERYKVFGRWSYDERLSAFTNQTYGLWDAHRQLLGDRIHDKRTLRLETPK